MEMRSFFSTLLVEKTESCFSAYVEDMIVDRAVDYESQFEEIICIPRTQPCCGSHGLYP